MRSESTSERLARMPGNSVRRKRSPWRNRNPALQQEGTNLVRRVDRQGNPRMRFRGWRRFGEAERGVAAIAAGIAAGARQVWPNGESPATVNFPLCQEPYVRFGVELRASTNSASRLPCPICFHLQWDGATLWSIRYEGS
jgi:hypothetical protein